MNHKLEGIRWSQKTDPEDADYVLIEVRIPNNPDSPMPTASYTGQEAVDRIFRWALGARILEWNGEESMFKP